MPYISELHPPKSADQEINDFAAVKALPTIELHRHNGGTAFFQRCSQTMHNQTHQQKGIPRHMRNLRVPIIISILCYIPHPRQGLVPALFYNLQITYLNAGYCEIWDLVFDCDGCALLDIEFCDR